MPAPEESPDQPPGSTPPAAGLPALTPDIVEQEAGEGIDNVIPTAGFAKLPVVGLGGSAGGLAALHAFFGAMPADCGMAFVVIMHLSPEHDSMLAEVLQRSTPMPVRQVRERVKVEANCVYVIPPAKHLSMADGHLHLSDLARPRPTKHVAVDLFFRTLADTHGAHSAAVVLSGADGDGAIGIKRIKERGGLTVAQDPDEAEMDSMPRSTIATGMVDWVLPAAEIPARLCGYWTLERRLRLPSEEGPPPADEPAAPAVSPAQPAATDEGALRDVFGFLRARTGRDFTYYKRATVLRRVARRMQVNGLEDVPHYLGFLRTHPGEAGALLQDLLISVTNFFRDREAFATLEAAVPLLFRGKGPKDTVRVWCAACATGEEAYSVAMYLHEYADKLAHPPTVQVFATDLDEHAIAQARDGSYPETIAADVSEERLRRFFHKGHGRYRVKREVRETVLFALHDLLKDPPFSRVDLVTCRNLLIYLNRDAQGRALDIFHFALNPDGLLFLGTSESVDEPSALFAATDKKYRLYARRAARPRLATVLAAPTLQARAWPRRHEEAPVLPQAIPPLPFLADPAPPEPTPADGEEPASWDRVHARAVERFGPPSIIIDAQHNLVHLSGHAGRLLQLGDGVPTTNLLRLIHPALRVELRAAIFRAVQSGQVEETFGVPLDAGDARRAVDLRVVPDVPGAQGCLLVLFTEREFVPEAAAQTPGGEPEPAVRELERELEQFKTQLRDTVEQSDASEEELKASNEELQAMNEELRSTTEELETGREELQSINEELSTVNGEMKSKVDELARANGDLQNLMAATQIATVFLDRQLCIGRYTPPAVPLFNLIPTDLGRPLADLTTRLNYPDLAADAQRVLDDLSVAELEVPHADGRCFLARMRPYRALDDRIEGVALTFVDITARKQTQDALKESELQFRSFVDVTSDTVYKMSADWNEMRFLEGKRFLADTLDPSRTWLETYIPLSDQPQVFAAIRDAIRRKRLFELEHRVVRVDGQVGWVFSRAIPLLDARGEIIEWIGAASDVTERRHAEEARRGSEERFRAVANIVPDLLWSSEPDGTMAWYNERWLGYTGQSFAEAVDGGWAEAIHPEDREAAERGLREAVASGRPLRQEHRIRRADGEYRFFLVQAEPLRDEQGQIVHWFGSATDIDDLARARAQAEAASQAKDHFLAVLSHELRTPLTPITMAIATLGQRRDLPAAVRDAHAMIKRNVELETRFIDDMLDVTRIVRGKMEIVRTDMDLYTAVRRAVEVSTPDIEAKGQRLTVRLPEEGCRLSGDLARLQQVFWNLLKNASKFTPREGSIEVRAHSGGEDAVVEVVDTGIGMKAEAAERIFNPFEQADVAIAREFGGLGLGLAIAKATVEAHGGTLRADSPGPGLGTTFTVSLPLAAPGAEVV